MELKKIAIFFAITLLLPACGLLKPIPGDLSLALTTSPELNPDSEGRSSPVVLRIYQLNSDTNFKESEFFDIFDDDKSALAETFIEKQELELNPNESRKFSLPLNEKTKYLGLVAAFRNIENAKWRELIEIKSSIPTGIPIFANNELTVRLEKNSITLNKQ